MTDLDKLTPQERANQLGNPVGEVGIAIGEALNRTNNQVIAAAYRHLQLEDRMHVLEVGFGNGHTLPALLAHAEGLRYTGIDISQTMVAEAIRFNDALVTSGQAAFRLASADAMPFATASFDRVVAVNVIYFLSDPLPALKEIRRVLRPSGTSLIAGIDPQSVASTPYAKPEYGFHVRAGDVLTALHRDAGFQTIEMVPYDEVTVRPDGTPWARRYSFVSAKP